MPKDAAKPRLSATILLLREGTRAPEVFMVERNHRIDFAEGALVFPGGKLEASDGDPELAMRCRDAARYSESESALRVAAIRETFEECGVLLARPRGENSLVGESVLRKVSGRYREALRNNDATMLQVTEDFDLELAFDLLVPFAHWITPEFMPKRFDTHFFLVEAPVDQLALHDGSESVDSLWTSVKGALELERTGRRTIIFPTLENLKKIGRSPTLPDAFERARREPIVTVLPRLSKDAAGETWMEIPETAGYETVRAPIAALMGGGKNPTTDGAGTADTDAPAPRATSPA